MENRCVMHLGIEIHIFMKDFVHWVHLSLLRKLLQNTLTKMEIELRLVEALFGRKTLLVFIGTCGCALP